MELRYLENGKTLRLDGALCTGCRECIEVCPHAVFALEDGRAVIRDSGLCMECGACARNCAAGALQVKTGVGCAAAIIGGMLRRTDPTCGSDAVTCGSGRKARAGSGCGCSTR